jgi:hypothetical protein
VILAIAGGLRARSISAGVTATERSEAPAGPGVGDIGSDVFSPNVALTGGSVTGRRRQRRGRHRDPGRKMIYRTVVVR